jgi:CubicO group peptidase (beta-lactamase class C family)
MPASFAVATVLLDGDLLMSPVSAARALLFALFVALGVVPSRAVAEPPLPQPPLELTAANLAGVVDPLMANWIDKRKGPGALVVVVKRDAVVFAKGYGFSDIAARTPFSADATLVRPGSISKLFTAIAVMQLADAGRLDLDRDVNGYIDFPVPVPQGGVPVTLRRLLTHRAGFEEHLKGLFSANREPEPLGRWLARNLPQRLFPKGDVEAYSNYGVALAGYIVERASGEPFASYVQRHILDPLDMRRSTFQQPLPDTLAPLMAKGYRAANSPPLPFFETIAMAPSGALSATGADMGRFMRALLGGGALDGVRILPEASLEAMMAPTNPTPAGYLGLAFFGTKVAGQDAIGHDGATMTFFSSLTLFPQHDVGIFVARDGVGEITAPKDLMDIPDPVTVIAQRFLAKPTEPDRGNANLVGDAGMAGIYHWSRRAESSFLRFSDLLAQRVVKVEDAGNARLHVAIWPFGNGEVLRRVGRNLYEGPGHTRIAFVDNGSQSYFALPALRLERVPWPLDVRWIAPAVALSTAIAVLTLMAWPIAVIWRYWRKRPWSVGGDRYKYLAVRMVLLADAAVIVAAVVLFISGSIDPTIFNAPLDYVLVVLYALAWLGVIGAMASLWVSVSFWRNGVGSRWSRIHHSLIATSTVMIAWLFVTFRFAGTTLNY